MQKIQAAVSTETTLFTVTLLCILEDSNLHSWLVSVFLGNYTASHYRRLYYKKLIAASIQLYKEYTPTFSFIPPVTALQVSARPHRDVTGRNQTCSNSIDLQVRFIGFATTCLCASDFVCVCAWNRERAIEETNINVGCDVRTCSWNLVKDTVIIITYLHILCNALLKAVWKFLSTPGI